MGTNLAIMLLSYLLGSIPTAYLFSRLVKKVDIRNEGSGNIGGMNAYRIAGLVPGILTVLIDAIKGALAVLIVLFFSGDLPVVFICGFLAVAGHNYSLFMKFRGGKGLATTLGLFVVISPVSILFAILCAVILTLILKDINTAFGSAALTIPVIVWLQYQHWGWFFFGLSLAIVIVIKHIPDYRAYAQGRRRFI